jgi:hypothetical protein
MRFNVFYAWESDRLSEYNHYFIRDAAKKAAKLVERDAEVDESPRVDYDTWNIPGTPEIAGTIFKRIDKADLFIADMTYVGTTDPKDGQTAGKQTCNPNVLVELGYAAAKLGWDRIVLVMNTFYGHPEDIIFDVMHRRWPQCYRLGPEDRDSQKNQFKKLVEAIRIQVRLAVDALHEKTAEIISRLDIGSHGLMSLFGTRDSFHLPPMTNKGEILTFTQFHAAAVRLLDLGVIVAAYDPRQGLYAYHWTYAGKLVLIKLGIKQPPRPCPDSPDFYTYIEHTDMRAT